jgi:aryl-alcohol dehydrogenase-like predicted oxidoreductase
VDAFVAYSPLGRGFLTGRFRTPGDLPPDDWRRNMPRFQDENFALNFRVVKRLEGLARRKGCTPAQLALAWLLSQGEDVVPIPGSKRRTRVEENIAALSIVLTPEDLAELDVMAPQGVAAGQRYQPAGMQAVNR